MLRLLRRCYHNAPETRTRLSARLICNSTFNLSEHNVSIDTSGLQRPQPHSHGDVVGKEPETAMAKHIKGIIRVRKRSLSIGIAQSLDLSASLAVSRRTHQLGRVHVGEAGGQLLINVHFAQQDQDPDHLETCRKCSLTLKQDIT